MSNPLESTKLEYKCDKLVAEFQNLAQENQGLWYDIPSQCYQIEANVARMEEIEWELIALQAEADTEDKKRRRAHLRVVK